MKKRRVFIAINIPDNIKTELALSFDVFARINNLKTEFKTKKENLHVTLKFLGLLSDDEVFSVIKKLKQLSLNLNPFYFKIIKIDKAPFNLKMAWAYGTEKEALKEAHYKISSELIDFDFSGNKKEVFIPHITLARFNYSLRDVDLKSMDVNLRFPVKSIELMESVKINGKRQYLTLESFNLKGYK